MYHISCRHTHTHTQASERVYITWSAHLSALSVPRMLCLNKPARLKLLSPATPHDHRCSRPVARFWISLHLAFKLFRSSTKTFFLCFSGYKQRMGPKTKNLFFLHLFFSTRLVCVIRSFSNSEFLSFFFLSCLDYKPIPSFPLCMQHWILFVCVCVCVSV